MGTRAIREIIYEGGRIANQDCYEFLATVPDGSIDFALIDPPYFLGTRNTNFENGGGKQYARLKQEPKTFGKWDECADALDFSLLFSELYRVLRKGGTAISFFDYKKVSELWNMMDKARFKMMKKVYWLKKNPMPRNQRITYINGAVEEAVMGVKGGRPTFNSKYNRGVYEYPLNHESRIRFHPTQKPTPLFQELIHIHSNEGDLVLDCFLGGGTTAWAAERMGRRFIGCEIDPSYFQQLSQRLQG